MTRQKPNNLAQQDQSDVISLDQVRPPSGLSKEQKLDWCIEEQLGGFGKFQLFAYFAVSSGINSVGFWFYQLGYLLLQEPKYACQLSGSVTDSTDIVCTSENICANDSRIVSWRIDENHENTLHNWHRQFDLMCWPKTSIASVCSMFWLGWCLTLLWMPRMGDIYGRKWLIAYNNLLSLALYLGVLFAPNIYFLGGVMFIWGLFNSIRTNIGFLYMTELMPKDKQNLIGTIWNCFEGCINLFATFWFMYVTTHWFGFVSIGLIFQLFTVFSVWYLPESPIYLLKRGHISELREALQQIADWNGTELDWDLLELDAAEDKIESTKRRQRRPDKAENVMKVSSLPSGTDDQEFKFWLSSKLPTNLLGLVYHFALSQDGSVCYLSFTTHTVMREAKSRLNKTKFGEMKVTVEAEDITRAELVATALNLPLPESQDSSTDESVPPLSFYLSKSDVVVNLWIMVFVWLFTVFNFYLVGFLVNTFDQIFLSSIASGVSEFIAQAFGGYIFERLGVRTSLCVSYSIAAIGGFAMLLYGLDHQKELVFPLLVLVMKFGISSAFNITYVCHKGCFPTLFATSSLGYCTFICRFFTAFTPMLAQVSQLVSTALFAVTSTIAAVIVLYIRQINESDYEYEPETKDHAKKVKFE